MSVTGLRALGFCGVDDTVEPELLAALSSRYDFIEWGILFREELSGTPRFASKPWLERLKRVNSEKNMRLAGHLCSIRCEEVLKGDSSFIHMLHETLGIGRFQINATAANNVDMSLVNAESAERLRSVMDAEPEVEFIIQRNAETLPLWEPLEARGLPPNMSFLFDESKGTGVVAAEWPEPPLRNGPGGQSRSRGDSQEKGGGVAAGFVPFGYAGGLGPTTIEAQITKMTVKTNKAAAALAVDGTRGGGGGGSGSGEGGRSGDVGIWVDMESSLRTTLADGADIFDVNKAMRCVLIVELLVERGVLTNVGKEGAALGSRSPTKKPKAF